VIALTVTVAELVQYHARLILKKGARTETKDFPCTYCNVVPML